MRLQTSCAALAAALATLASAGAASAQETSFSFNAAVGSDYIFRGVSQTLEEPAVSAGMDLTWGSFYAGTWVSNVDFGDSTDAEIDFYGGVRGEAGGFAFDFGAVAYAYTNVPDGADYSYVEFKAAASRAIGPATVGAAVFVSPDFFGVDDEATYAELNASFAPADKWTVSGAVGHQWLDVSDDYAAWNVGASYAITENLIADVRYHDTDVENIDIYDARVVGSLKVVF